MNASWLEIWYFALISMFGDTISKGCNPNVCLTWKVSRNQLTLICKVRVLRYRVLISNPYGVTQADCSPPTPTVICDPHYKNVSVHQNPLTNETVVNINGTIDPHVNGFWTCRHGTGRGEAKTEVTVLAGEEIFTEGPIVNRQRENDCIRDTLLYTMGGFIFSVVITLTINAFCRSNTSELKDTINRRKIICRCIPYRSRFITGFKRLTFAVLTLSLFGIASVTALFDNNRCIVQWILLVISVIVGCLSTLTFLTRDKYTVESKNSNGESTTLTTVIETVESGDTSL